MAVLSNTERASAHEEFMGELSRRRETCAANKAELLAAINAMDQWIDDNKASANTALPVAARTNLTVAQKAEVLIYVIRRRWEQGA